MKDKFKKITLRLFALFFLICSTVILINTEGVYASENVDSILIKKVSKSYTKKFCNAIGFGLSKESAMNFSIEENKQAFKKKKEFNSINKDLLADKISISVIEKCGYPLNLFGEEGVQEFKSYYLSKDK